MNDKNLNHHSQTTAKTVKNETGSAIVVALLMMVLLLGFVVLAVSRTTSETISSSNDVAETRAFEAAHAGLEVMTRNFNKIFEIKLAPDSSDLLRIEGQYPEGFTDRYTFDQRITQTEETREVIMTGEMFQGLNASRDEWQLDITVTDKVTGVQVAVRRKFLNNRIPIFQFGIFYDDDLEVHPGPRFDFGGRVHANGSLFLAAQTGLYFSSKVTAKDHVFTDVQKNGFPYSNWGDNVFIRNASGSYVPLRNNMGSVLQSPTNGTPVSTNPLPTAYSSANWDTNEGLFQGNLLAYQKPLELPIKLNSDIAGTNLSLNEIVKRGKSVGDLWNDGTGTSSAPNIVPVAAENADDRITSSERYFNKTGMRIALADSKAKLPGCATVDAATACGVRLDGDASGSGANAAAGDARGYRPYAMTGAPAYAATRINGERFYTGREVWIKVETVNFNPATQAYDVSDITHDILSLGVTEPAPSIGDDFYLTEPGYGAFGNDSRSVIKLQRFMMSGATLPNTTGATGKNTFRSTNASWTGGPHNFVVAATVPSMPATNTCSNTAVAETPVNAGVFPTTGSSGDHRAHWKNAVVGAGTTTTLECVVPFPINMFDTREGLYNDTTAVFTPTAAGNYGARVPWAGVMSMVDIDVANLRAFLNGDHDPRMPVGTPFANAAGRPLRASDIPDKAGWVFYVSDRRGDFDFDGEYDMEDIYGPNDSTLQPGEDTNANGVLDANYFNGEAVRFTGFGTSESPDIAALFEHRYFRRGVRLINGQRLPGRYDSDNDDNTKGFTVASENGVYVLGNYNATGVASYGTPTPATAYLPQNTAEHIPASIAADAIIILSNNWADARSFQSPFTMKNRNSSETTVRFAILSGDALSSLNATPNQGGDDPRMNGGVHNFPRFLENWGQRLNYSGSLINLFNARNNNGAFKCCDKVYSPPQRNWVFDTTFRDMRRLPPGTPFFQSVQITGFERRN